MPGHNQPTPLTAISRPRLRVPAYYIAALSAAACAATTILVIAALSPRAAETPAFCSVEPSPRVHLHYHEQPTAPACAEPSQAPEPAAAEPATPEVGPAAGLEPPAPLPCLPAQRSPDRPIGVALDALGALDAQEPALELIGVAASPSMPGVLAAWTRHHIHVSRDDGKTWSRILSGSGEVAHVVVDCHGQVFALRGVRRLGVATPSGYQRWHDVPVDDPEQLDGAPWSRHPHRQPPLLAAGGGYVAVLIPETIERSLAVSPDSGHHWKTYDMYTDPESQQAFALTADGEWRSLFAWWGCMSGGQILQTGSASAAPHTRDVPATDAFSFVDADGWLYTASDVCGAAGRACVLAPGADDWRASAATVDDDFRMINSGTRALALIGSDVYRARRGRLTRTGLSIPEEVEPMSIDSSDRVLGIIAGRVVRSSARHSWRVLLDDKDL